MRLVAPVEERQVVLGVTRVDDDLEAALAIYGAANAEAGVDSPIQHVDALVVALGEAIDEVVRLCSAAGVDLPALRDATGFEHIALRGALGALDPLVRSDLQQQLKAIFARLKKTVVLVTHDMNEAAFLGETIVLMRAGAVVQQGRVEDLLQRPAAAFVSEFIGAQRSHLPSIIGGGP